MIFLGLKSSQAMPMLLPTRLDHPFYAMGDLKMMHQDASPDTVKLPEGFRAQMLERLEDVTAELPLLPSLAWQLIEMGQRDDLDARQFTGLIHRDQALAGHVLRLANSAAFRPRLPIISLHQAVSRLGTNQLAELAFAVALRSRVFHVPGYEPDIRDMWRHSVGTATYAREIARLVRAHAEGAFLCGLLHDIGKPFVLQLLIDLQEEFREPLPPLVVRAAVEEYHVLAGGRLAAHWDLPLHAFESIMYHHDRTARPVCAEFVALIRLASAISSQILTPQVEQPGYGHLLPLLADLNSNVLDLEAILAKRAEVLTMVEALA
jgi:putative nucleotidyltransferase with HDIG domain